MAYHFSHYRELLGDRYEFEGTLGRGASAIVFRARNRRLGRLEAVKILTDSFGTESTARFVGEAKTVAALDHPHIVRLYDYGEVHGVLWYSMQLVHGPTLREELQARGRFDPVSTLRIAVPLADALTYSHRQGIIHRDLKPANIILSPAGWPYLMDFGIAKTGDSSLKTMTGSVLGTPAYMAPEQAEGKPLDGRADVYSFGVVLFHLLTGRVPFEGDEPMQLLLRRLREDPPALRPLVPEIDPELERLVLGTLAREPDLRIGSAEQLGALLAGRLARERHLPPFEIRAEKRIEPDALATRQVAQAPLPPPSGPPTTLPDRPESPSRWGRGVARGLSVGLPVFGLVLGVIALVALLGWPQARPSPPVETPPVVAATPAPTPAEPASEVPTPPVPPREMASAVAQPTPEAGPRREPKPAPGRPPAEPAGEPAGRPVRFPRLVESVEPNFSNADNGQCAGVSVVVSVHVGADGRPTVSRVLSSVPEACAALARETVARYRFEPAADASGRPVPATATLTLALPGESP